MNFGWIKKLFKKEVISDNKTSDVATIDTSLVYVPKFNDLTNEEKSIVLEELKDLNKNNDYETLLKFSSDLVDISNRERFILTETLDRYHKWFDYSKKKCYESIKEEKLGESICFGLISNLEFEIIVKKLLNVKKELELKAVAIDLFIEQKEKERKPLRELFKHANRLENINLKNRLLSEKDRIKISLKINDQILRTIYFDIQENDTLRKEYSVLQRVLDNSQDKTNNYIKKYILNALRDKLHDYKYNFFGTGFDNIFLNDLKSFGKKMVGKKTPQSYLTRKYNKWKPITYAKFCEKNKIITQNMVDEAFRLATEKSGYCNFYEFIDLIPETMIEDFFKFVANTFHNMEVFCYEHKEDYKKYIENINTIVNEYEATPTDEWDKEKLVVLTSKYDLEIYSYFELLKNYLTEEHKIEVINSFSKLLFLCNIKEVYLNCNLYYKIGNYDIKFEEYVNQLLTKVENKYNISLYDDNDTFFRKNIINDSKHYIINLYDLLLGNNDILKSKIISYSDDFYKKIKMYFDKSTCCYFDTIGHIHSIEEFYYLTKYMKLNFDDICKYAMKCYNLIEGAENRDTYLAKIITQIGIRKLENNYDDRIIVFPNNMVIKNYREYDPDNCMHDIDELKTNDNQIAIFLSDINQIIEIVNTAKGNESIKYIIVNEYIFNVYKLQCLVKLLYKKFIFEEQIPKNLYKILIVDIPGNRYISDLDRKKAYRHIEEWISNNKEMAEELFNEIIKNVNFLIVPENTEYKELSSYLDKELEKEQENQKVLSKIYK